MPAHARTTLGARRRGARAADARAARVVESGVPLDPYPHQKAAVRAVAKALSKGAARALVVMASGLGKTATAAFVARDLVAARPGRVLFLAHRVELLEQARETFAEVFGPAYTTAR